MKLGIALKALLIGIANARERVKRIRLKQKCRKIETKTERLALAIIEKK